jgi:lipoyl(octanoyl) transferase
MEMWRVITSQNLEGAWNMASDEAILEAVGQHQVPPTLRLYSWNPPCLSLGYAQPVKDVDCDTLEEAGWRLVRRPTGGRAILHTDELTYSVIGPLNEPRLAGGVLESYRRISLALLQALHSLGLPARADQSYPLPAGAQQNGAVCFEVPSNYEITASGKKIIGSAQSRRLAGILQHGSLPLTGDLTRITRVLNFSSETDRNQAAQRLLEHAATLEAVLGRVITWDEAARAFITAFEQCLEIKLTPAFLTGGELKRAAELVKSKYANPDWTRRF